jgi:hypothetical protein
MTGLDRRLDRVAECFKRPLVRNNVLTQEFVNRLIAHLENTDPTIRIDSFEGVPMWQITQWTNEIVKEADESEET